VSLLSDSLIVASDKNKASSWAEFIIPETAGPLTRYDDPFLKKYPAITENKFGKGSCISMKVVF
jgi:beta-galactosidase